MTKKKSGKKKKVSVKKVTVKVRKAPRRKRVRGGRKRSSGFTKVSPGLGGVATRNIDQNAAVYVDSLLHPFETGPARLPEPTGFPSTVAQQRWRSSSLVFAPTPGPGQPGALWGVALTPFVASPVFTMMSSAGLNNDAWMPLPLPSLSTIQSNFYYTRCTAVGIRVIDTAAMLNRGGTLYISRLLLLKATMPNDARYTARNSMDTVMLDLAKLPTEGVEVCWLPLTLQPMTATGTTGNYAVTGSAYQVPTITTPTDRTDSAVVVFAELPAVAASNPYFEFVYKYEAVPFPQTQYLFDLRTVAGSTDAAAKAFEEVQAMSASSSAPSLTAGPAAVSPSPIANFLSSGAKVLGTVGEGLSTLGGGSIPGVSMIPRIAGAISQVTRHGLLGGVMHAVGLEDYMSHLLAVNFGCPELSPVLTGKAMSVEDILDHLQMARRKKH